MTRLSTQALALFLGLIASSSQAESEKPSHPRSALFDGSVGTSQPAVELPAYVPAPQGQVTLWADFAHATEDKVPLYLVNRTNSPREFSSQDHDIYIKLEYKDATGQWARAQSHFASWCGNSYYSVSLPPGQFFAFFGYRPKEGAKHTVRYASDRTMLVSNEGEGLISATDLKDVARDGITAGKIPYAISQAIEPRQTRDPYPFYDCPKAATAIRLLKLIDRNEAALDWVRMMKGVLETRPPSEDVKEALMAADEILSYTWPTEIKPDALLSYCIQAATIEKTNTSKTEALRSEPTLLWGLLSDMRFESKSRPSLALVDLTTLKAVMLAAAQAVMKEPNEAGVLAAKVLDEEGFADQVIPTTQCIDWALSPQPLLQKVAIKALMRRMDTKSLTDLAVKFSPGGQILVLVTIVNMHQQPSEEAEQYCLHCMSTQPLETANALWSQHESGKVNSLSLPVHGALYNYLKVEAERAAGIHQSFDLGPDAQKLIAAVEMLASWHMKEDTPVFELLLKHPGTGGIIGLKDPFAPPDSNGQAPANFAVQNAARQALTLLEKAIPSPP